MNQNISDAEWSILHALWKKPYQPLSEVIENVKNPRWTYKSYFSFLKRMCEKGLVDFEMRRGDKYYFAAIDYQTSLDKETNHLIGRISPRAAKDLVLNLIKAQTLTEDDQREIRTYLEQMDSEAGE